MTVTAVTTVTTVTTVSPSPLLAPAIFQDTEAFAGDRIPLYILAFFGTFYAYKYYLANDRLFSVGRAGRYHGEPGVGQIVKSKSFQDFQAASIRRKKCANLIPSNSF